MTNLTLNQYIEKKNYDRFLTFDGKGRKLVGFKAKHRVNWWWALGDNDDDVLLFDHTYSMNTGQTFKGRKHQFNIESRIHDTLNK